MSAAEKMVQRVFDALPDATDFRDLLFTPTLVEVPPRIDPQEYLKYGTPVLDQRGEGACTGFALATIANYLLRRRGVDPDRTGVSPRMLYEMAKRYDEWPGEEYSGSSARGAVKGWHKHGICSEALWPYHAGVVERELSETRVQNALLRPLGAYYRVNHKDIVAMHSALVEVGILFATAQVHEGWYQPDASFAIPPSPKLIGGHAFALVAYNEEGFWVQNSWGGNWGRNGLALLTYDDWLEHGTDLWVARLGAPIRLHSRRATVIGLSESVNRSQAFTATDIRSHIISVGNDGRLRTTGTYGTRETDVKGIIDFDFLNTSRDWPKKRLLIYAHGGLVSERSAVERIADYRTKLVERQIYPIAFIWKTDYWTTFKNVLADALTRRQPAEGIIDAALDFVRDRLDDALEPLARDLTGKLVWDEMKENGILATKNEQGAGRILLKHLIHMLDNNPDVEVHFAAHSAGSIFLAPLVQLFTGGKNMDKGPLKNRDGYDRSAVSCSLWAPAITTQLFKETYLPAIRSKQIERFALFTLTDKAEQDDDCANIYHKSLLYLISNALEEHVRIRQMLPLADQDKAKKADGEALLGMQKFVGDDKELQTLFKSPRANWILAPNTFTTPGTSSRSQHHGDFDNDDETLASTIATILGK